MFQAKRTLKYPSIDKVTIKAGKPTASDGPMDSIQSTIAWVESPHADQFHSGIGGKLLSPSPPNNKSPYATAIRYNGTIVTGLVYRVTAKATGMFTFATSTQRREPNI